MNVETVMLALIHEKAFDGHEGFLVEAADVMRCRFTTVTVERINRHAQRIVPGDGVRPRKPCLLRHGGEHQ